MTKIYIRKITEKSINPLTGEAWKIDDVPDRWREDVQRALESESGD